MILPACNESIKWANSKNSAHRDALCSYCALIARGWTQPHASLSQLPISDFPKPDLENIEERNAVNRLGGGNGGEMLRKKRETNRVFATVHLQCLRSLIITRC